MPDAATITAARTLLQAWRTELHEGHVNCSTGQVDDADAARDIAELDQVIADLATPADRAKLAEEAKRHADEYANLWAAPGGNAGARASNAKDALHAAIDALAAALAPPPSVAILDLVRALERSAANTDTDWRWTAAKALRCAASWETASIALAAAAPPAIDAATVTKAVRR